VAERETYLASLSLVKRPRQWRNQSELAGRRHDALTFSRRRARFWVLSRRIRVPKVVRRGRQFALTGLGRRVGPCGAPPARRRLASPRPPRDQPPCSLEARRGIVEDGGHPVVSEGLGVPSRRPEELQAGAPQDFDPVAFWWPTSSSTWRRRGADGSTVRASCRSSEQASVW